MTNTLSPTDAPVHGQHSHLRAAVGQFQCDLQNELTAEGIAAAEAGGRYGDRPAALAGTHLDEVRAAYCDQGTSVAALTREHGVSRVAVRTALADLLPNPRISPDLR